MELRFFCLFPIRNPAAQCHVCHFYSMLLSSSLSLGQSHFGRNNLLAIAKSLLMNTQKLRLCRGAHHCLTAELWLPVNQSCFILVQLAFLHFLFFNLHSVKGLPRLRYKVLDTHVLVALYRKPSEAPLSIMFSHHRQSCNGVTLICITS